MLFDGHKQRNKHIFLFIRFTTAVGSNFECATFRCGRKSESLWKRLYGTEINKLRWIGESCRVIFVSDIQPSSNILLSAALQPVRGLGSFGLRYIVDTQIDTVGRTSLSEWSARHKCGFLHNIKQTQETNIHSLSGIRTLDCSKQVAAVV
jgi:hypothetical protein